MVTHLAYIRHTRSCALPQHTRTLTRARTLSVCLFGGHRTGRERAGPLCSFVASQYTGSDHGASACLGATAAALGCCSQLPAPIKHDGGRLWPRVYVLLARSAAEQPRRPHDVPLLGWLPPLERPRGAACGKLPLQPADACSLSISIHKPDQTPPARPAARLTQHAPMKSERERREGEITEERQASGRPLPLPPLPPLSLSIPQPAPTACMRG